MPPKKRKTVAATAPKQKSIAAAVEDAATVEIGADAPIGRDSEGVDAGELPARTEMRTLRAPVQTRSKKRMATVLRAAAELLEETGVRGFTIRGLERRANVSSGWIYRFFPDRDAIIEAVMLDFSARSRDVVPAMPVSESWQQTLSDEVQAMVDLHRTSPGMGAVWLSRRRTGLVEQADQEANDLIASQLTEKLLPWATVSKDELLVRVRTNIDAGQAMIEQAFRSGQGENAWLIGEITRMRVAYLAPCFAPEGSAGLDAPLV